MGATKRVFRRNEIEGLLLAATGRGASMDLGGPSLRGTLAQDGDRVRFESHTSFGMGRSPTGVELKFSSLGHACRGFCNVLARPDDRTWLLDRPTLVKVVQGRQRERANVDTTRLIVSHHGSPVAFEIDDLSEGGTSIRCPRETLKMVFREHHELKALIKSQTGTLPVIVQVRSHTQSETGGWKVGLRFIGLDSASLHAIRKLMVSSGYLAA